MCVFVVMELLQLCDVIRDDMLPELGVRLEDHEGDRSGTWKSACLFFSFIWIFLINGCFCFFMIFVILDLFSRPAHCGETGGQGDTAEGEGGEEEGEKLKTKG